MIIVAISATNRACYINYYIWPFFIALRAKFQIRLCCLFNCFIHVKTSFTHNSLKNQHFHLLKEIYNCIKMLILKIKKSYPLLKTIVLCINEAKEQLSILERFYLKLFCYISKVFSIGNQFLKSFLY